MSLFHKFKDRPDLALVELFEQPKATWYGKRPCVFVWTGSFDRAGVRYGSFKNVYLDELSRRTYQIEWVDYAPAVYYTDVWYNPRTHKNEPR